MAPRTPITQLPVSAQTTIPKNAPASIIPSSPMFTTPERSQKMPPIAASASGVAKRSVAATRPMLKTDSSSVAASFWNQMAQAIAMIATPIAHQPSFRLAPRERPEAERGAEDGHGRRDDEVADRERRDREPQREDAEADPGDRERARLAQPPQAVLERRLGVLGDAHAPVGSIRFGAPKPTFRLARQR